MHHHVPELYLRFYAHDIHAMLPLGEIPMFLGVVWIADVWSTEELVTPLPNDLTQTLQSLEPVDEISRKHWEDNSGGCLWGGICDYFI